MANIKMLKTALVGNTVRQRGWAGPSDDDEAKGLIAAGYAKRHAGEVADADKDALAAMLDGTVAEVSERLAGMSKADLKKLSKLEAKGGNRVTLIAAIDAAAEAAE